MYMNTCTIETIIANAFIYLKVFNSNYPRISYVHKNKCIYYIATCIHTIHLVSRSQTAFSFVWALGKKCPHKSPFFPDIHTKEKKAVWLHETTIHCGALQVSIDNSHKQTACACTTHITNLYHNSAFICKICYTSFCLAMKDLSALTPIL